MDSGSLPVLSAAPGFTMASARIPRLPPEQVIPPRWQLLSQCHCTLTVSSSRLAPVFTACPSGEGSISCLLGTPLPGTPPNARTAPPQAGTAWPTGPGTPAGGISVVGAPVPAPGILSAQAPASGLTFPTVTPGPGLTPSPAVPGPLDGSLSAVSDRLPLSGRQIELQAADLGLLAIALVITIARVSVRGRTLRPRRPIRSPRRVPGHPVDANACQNVAREAASPAAGK